jgi:hypothetical protein
MEVDGWILKGVKNSTEIVTGHWSVLDLVPLVTLLNVFILGGIQISASISFYSHGGFGSPNINFFDPF